MFFGRRLTATRSWRFFSSLGGVLCLQFFNLKISSLSLGGWSKNSGKLILWVESLLQPANKNLLKYHKSREQVEPKHNSKFTCSSVYIFHSGDLWVFFDFFTRFKKSNSDDKYFLLNFFLCFCSELSTASDALRTRHLTSSGFLYDFRFPINFEFFHFTRVRRDAALVSSWGVVEQDRRIPCIWKLKVQVSLAYQTSDLGWKRELKRDDCNICNISLFFMGKFNFHFSLLPVFPSRASLRKAYTR